MSADKFLSMRFGALELEPMEGAPAPAPAGRAVFTPNTRSAPRRAGVDRRERPRMDAPRRAADDRREKRGWDRALP